MYMLFWKIWLKLDASYEFCFDYWFLYSKIIVYLGKEFLNRHAGVFLLNLDKKIDRTVTYYDDFFIPRTNNNIEG